MRVTLRMTSGRVLDNLAYGAERLQEAQNQTSSGKRISKPSDDVTGTTHAMHIRSSLSAIGQYERNAGIAKSQLSITSTTLDTVVTSLSDVKKLAVQAGNAALSDESRIGITSQLDSIMNTLVGAANTQYDGKYILSGSQTNKRPIIPNGGATPYSYQGDGLNFLLQVAPGSNLSCNVTGDMVFNMGGASNPAAPDVFSVIKALRDDIAAGDVAQISQHINDVDAVFSNVNAIRSQVGGRMNRLEVTNASLADSKTTLSELLSQTEDVDLAQAVLDLRTRENVYQAAIGTASRVLNLSLVDYMK